jgi:dCTP deaminase
VLSAESINDLINEAALEWRGELRGDGLLLTLGSPLLPLAAPSPGLVDLADQSSIDDLYAEPITNWKTHDLKSGDMVLAAVERPLRLGAGLMGMIGGLTHLARVGLAVHVTSPFVLPGWNGHLTMELVNTGPAVLRLYHGMPLARLLVFAQSGLRTAKAVSLPFSSGPAGLKSRYAEEFFGG